MFQHSVAPWCFKAALCNKVSTLFYVCAGIRQSVDIIIHLCICPAKCWHHVRIIDYRKKKKKSRNHHMSVQLSSKVLTSSYICAFIRRQVDIMSFCESSKVLESLHVCAGVSVQRDVSIIIYYLPVQTPKTWHHHMYVKVYIFKKKSHHKNIVSVHDPIF